MKVENCCEVGQGVDGAKVESCCEVDQGMDGCCEGSLNSEE